MELITDKNYSKKDIGTKAHNLFILKERGFNIPDLFCVPANYEIGDGKEIVDYINDNFQGNNLFSVRSSGNSEDGNELSYAGQFETYLNTKKEEVIERIEACRTETNNYDVEMNVIVQEMILSEISGVIFTANPQGILNEIVITIGRGLGENVVQDKVQTTSYYYNRNDDIYYYEKQDNSPTLTDEMVHNLVDEAKKIEEIFGENLDIEFGIKDNKIYILQTRKITTLNIDKKIVLDNSNIVESYPGITLPLTQSFIREAYYLIFKSVLYRLTKSKDVVNNYDEVLKNIVVPANGRIYYEIDNFYNILLLLPFRKKIIPIWQEMLGVENKDIVFDKNLNVGPRVKAKIISSFIHLLKTNLKEMEELMEFFGSLEKHYYDKFKKDISNEDLLKLYNELEKETMERWDITLVNDMYAFLYTGLVKRQLKKEHYENYVEISNKLISSLKNLESMKPIKELISISRFVKENKLEKEIYDIKTDEDYYKYIESKNNNKELVEKIVFYIKQYGDRCVEELKLESETFRIHPILLINKIKSYIEDERLFNYTFDEAVELDTNFSKKVKKYLENSEAGIRNREASRLCRTKLYGFVRSIFLEFGARFEKEKIIEDKRDIFYLYKDEIVDIIHGKNIDVKEIISNRKKEFDMYKLLPVYSRLIFANKVINKNHTNINNVNLERDVSGLKGTPASNGEVKGIVQIVSGENVSTVDTKDKIIVCKMTDPGWVYVIAQAKGLIVEKGSLLSHTAIISRELKKPAIVGVKDATSILKDGDYIQMNANTGEIEVIKDGNKDS